MEPKTCPVCPICGWEDGALPASPVFLAPRTVLDGGYLLGNVLGAGGFGITYLAWDLNLKRKLAIKEYFPNAFGMRAQDHCTVAPSGSQNKAAFEHGLEKFLEEGQALAKFQDHPGVVSVVTFFRENGTSYLVMKYEEGITLQEYLKQQGGRIDVQTALDIVTPVMDTLRAVHAAGILHRDISPDNIFINRSGQVKLLDFGAAKHDMASQGKSLQVNLKRGYSPAEQYSKKGKQGPWTDVYALAATIYQAVTGQVPPEALDRLEDDPLESPSALGIVLPRDVEGALMRALSVRHAGRFQTMKAFQEAILSTRVITAPDPGVDSADREKGRESPGGGARQKWQWLRDYSGAARQKWQWFREQLRVPGVRRAIGAAAVCLLLLPLVALLRPVLLLPRVSRFAAEPSTIMPGQHASLSWSIDNGSVIINPGIGRVRENSGTRQVSPAVTTTYTLTARRLLRSVTRSATVIVQRPKALAVNFTVEPRVIKRGAEAELVWSVDGGPATVTIDPDIGQVKNSDRRKVSPASTTTYTLRAEKAGAPAAQASVTVELEAPATVPKPVISLFEVEPTTIRLGQDATLTWNVVGNNAAVTLDHGIGIVKHTDSMTITPSMSSTYKLVASAPGGIVSRSVTIAVIPPNPPSISSFAVQPSTILRGQYATLHWSVGGELETVSIEPDIGSVSREGTIRVSPVGSTTYTLTAKGPGGSVSLSAAVVVNQPPRSELPKPVAPVISSFTVVPRVIAPGQIVTLAWNITGDVTEATLQPNFGAVQPQDRRRVAPQATTTYILTARGPSGNAVQQLRVEVSTEPFSILKFDVRPKSIAAGESARISWKVTGPVNELGITPDAGSLTTSEGEIQIHPTTTTQYVLTARSGDQIKTKHTQLRVR